MAALAAGDLHFRAEARQRTIGRQSVRQEGLLQPQRVVALERRNALGRGCDVLGEYLARVDHDIGVLAHAGACRLDMGFILGGRKTPYFTQPNLTALNPACRADLALVSVSWGVSPNSWEA